MIAILLSDNSFEQDIRELLMAFYPGETFTHKREEAAAAGIIVKGGRDGSNYDIALEDTTRPPEERAYLFACVKPDFSNRFEAKNMIKRTLYGLLRTATGRELPWGTLTGIRPAKIAMTKLLEGRDEVWIRNYMKETYLTGDEKILLCLNVAKKELSLLSEAEYTQGYSLYIGIPFCPTTCLYCSFTSFPIGRWEGRTGEYLTALFREMEYVAGRMKGRPLDTVYIGGGTPTSLSPGDLEAVLSKLKTTFPVDRIREFTVEAGRPDSITEEKLKVLRAHGITRISINPQTMNRKTLEIIGRRHTVEDVRDKFHLARGLGFDNINMDLIAGLPGETVDDVRNTMEEIKALSPDSITVHSLAVKRAARLNMLKEHYSDLKMNNTQEIIGMTARYAEEMGLSPYYLYRQKNMAGNFENVGYAAPGKECVYNILIMEEKQTIMACGAGTTTKVLYPTENRLERAENVKEVEQYIGRIDEMLERKEKLIPVME